MVEYARSGVGAMKVTTNPAQSITRQSSDRMQSVDIVRAVAIICVVLGHALIFAKCGTFLMSSIYSFHMALMFALSGFVTAASWERSGEDGLRLARSKVVRSAKRLLVPYAICGIAVMPIGNFLLTGDFAESFITGWRNAFLINRFLWYLPCCFFLVCIFAAVALATRRTGGVRWLAGVGAAFALVVAAHLLVPAVDYLRSVMNYFAAFFAGAWLWTRRDAVLNPGRRLLVCTSIAFVALAVAFPLMPEIPLFSKNIVKPVAGVAALFPLMALAGKIKGPAASGMALVGRTTLFLYCFDFFATPLSVRFLKPTGVLPTIATAIFVVALGTFINLAWEYAILPKIKKPYRTCRTGRGRGV